MAVRTSSSTARNISYSKPSTPKKPASASRPTSSSKPSTSSQTKQAVSAPKRDTFTYSSQTAKQTADKTLTTKTSTAPKTTQTKTSTTKTNTAAKTNSTKSTTTKSTSAASNKNRDTFTYTSPAAKTAVKLTQKGTVSAQKNTKVSQTKTAVKNNASNKTAVSGSLSKNKTKSAQNTVPDGLKLHLKHTTDPKQKAAMQKTIEQNKKDKLNNKFDNKIITNGKILTDDPRIKVGIYTGNKYTIVDGNTPSRSDVSTLNQDEKNYLVYLALHEAGGTGGFPSSLENPEAQMTAIVSSFMNAYEVSYYNKGDIDNIDGSKTNSLRTFNDAMATHCTQYASDEYTKNTLTNNLRNGDYSGLDFSNYTNEQIKCAETAVNTVLSGIRNINATAWYATNSDRNTFQQNTWFAPQIKLKE